MVACGDVAGMKKEKEGEGVVTVGATVHAQMKSSDWYQPSISFSSDNNIVATSCTCKCETHNQSVSFCKHKAALLLALFALATSSSATTPPLIFKRKNMNVFKGATSEKLLEQVRYGMEWQDNIKLMTSPPPKKRAFSSSYNNIITDPTKKKRQKKDDNEPLFSKKVVELKKMCADRGLKVGGNKEDLVKRVREHDNQK